ncbi:hypothetical protein AVEN_251567-1 [Araneus ventricosus]|uniref:Uncharacterized protein n=1 Tax=Araneus ventricosus TaxID=182803 RepID=A0A4Y2FDL7_ARAVE|nr:hypothetical protein AVEN_251567-1 [Araneus ventricosus]
MIIVEHLVLIGSPHIGCGLVFFIAGVTRQNHFQAGFEKDLQIIMVWNSWRWYSKREAPAHHLTTVREITGTIPEGSMTLSLPVLLSPAAILTI